LENLYLDPLREKVKLNKGFIYHDEKKNLALMIDLKTEGISTLNNIVSSLQKYPELLACKTLTISISGNVPDRSQWNNFPIYIYFDGRPGIEYTSDELKRISFISTRYKAFASWDGTGALPETDRQKLSSLRNAVHAKNKKLRLWGAPDVPAAWQTWIELQIDILGTDRVSDLALFLKKNQLK
jgi:alkaline phosphatase